MTYSGPDDPLWYRDAVMYELHVRSFHDSNADGIGDFPGLTQRLDYLKDLGVNALWLLPFYPSPLKDDGYDIADYTAIQPAYGTMKDFREFLRQAHRRGMRVITELLLNHTSDQHPWFQRARKAAPGSRWRDFYVWSDSPEKYKSARIIFKDFEKSNWTWDPVAKAYYWHRFYSHQPDLNFESPLVQKALLRVVDFWFGMGVDGMRLDAVPYFYERENTSCENLPETHEMLKKLRKHVDAKHKNRMLLAEANQWPEDAAAYFGTGDECHMAFHFPIMPRMFMALQMEDRYPLVDILAQTPALPETCQWALFLRNHDELTLEMVTDEERDYMYRVYAHDVQARINLGIRRRLSPLLQNNRRKIELLNGLLFSMPGTPIIYYGDEIGMGDNIYLGDRNGVRTPMQWSSDRNAGFSRGNPQKLFLPIIIDPEYHYEAVNVEAQQNNPHSMLWWMKRLIALSRRHKAFGRGTMETLPCDNRKILAFLRRYGDETILVVANLSRFVQYAELDLATFKGHTPVELFGRSEFPKVGDKAYSLALAPHGFYWFALEPAREGVRAPPAPPKFQIAGEWKEVFAEKARPQLEEAIAVHLPARRWYSGKGHAIRSAKITDVFEFGPSMFAIAHVEFMEGDRHIYSLPMSFASGDEAEHVRKTAPQAVIASLNDGVLYDAMHDPKFAAALLRSISKRSRVKANGNRILAAPTPSFSRLRIEPDLAAVPLKGDQSNSSLVYGDKLILKLLRRLEPGRNPDLEVGRYLSEKALFEGTPAVAGQIELRRADSEPITLAVVHEFVPNQGNAWKLALDQLDRYFEAVLAHPDPLDPAIVPRTSVFNLIDEAPPAIFQEMVGSWLELARSLGQRTADLHLALATGTDDPEFAPEPFTPFYQRSLYQSMRNQLLRTIGLLRKRLRELPDNVHPDAEVVLALEDKILKSFHSIALTPIQATRLRCHGDFHLGQVLYTGRDFVILDFEGEPHRSVGERRIKRSPLKDVAGMIRSFDYVAHEALFRQQSESEAVPDRAPLLQTGAQLWQMWSSSAFLRAYLSRASSDGFLPKSKEALRVLLNAFLLDKCVYELAYELHNRPEWVRIPLKGLLRLMDALAPDAVATLGIRTR